MPHALPLGDCIVLCQANLFLSEFDANNSGHLDVLFVDGSVGDLKLDSEMLEVDTVLRRNVDDDSERLGRYEDFLFIPHDALYVIVELLTSS